MLGLDDNEENELPEEYKQGLYYPTELKNNELDSFSMRELYNIHLGVHNKDRGINGNGHGPSSTSFFNSASAMTTIRTIDIAANPNNQSLSGSGSGSDEKERKSDIMACEGDFYQLVFDIKHCIFKAGNDTKLLFSIYDYTDNRIISEEYCLHLSGNNFPKVGSPEDCKVLFKNLSYDVLQHDIYITCRIYRIGPMEAPDVMSSKQQKKSDKKNKSGSKAGNEIVRPYASTVIPLRDHINKLFSCLGEEVKFEPGTAPICCPRDESNFIPLIFDLIKKEKQNQHYIAPLSIGIAHGLILYRGGVEVVEKNYSFYDKLTEVETVDIDPTLHIDRHILYVTIRDVHVNQRNKRAACNVCIKMQLRDNNTYKALPGSMMLGKGKMAVPTSETVSPVYYHNNDPLINQTYHILIPSNIDVLSNCHLYFTLWHIPATNKKPDERGFAYIKLFHNKLKQLTADNEYELPLYRHVKSTQNMYLDNKSLKAENKSIRILFKLSSTKIYSNIDIHKFLTWKNHNVESVVQSVKRVAKQPFTQLLTILDELMACIFSIMLESNDNGLIEQTYATLIGLLGEANKNTTSKYKPRIEEWIEFHFKYSRIWRTLSVQQLRLLRWIASSEAILAQSKEASTLLKQRSAEMIRQLQHSMRGVKYLFNIMKRSCQIEIKEAKTQQRKQMISQEYNKQIALLFESMNKIMGQKQPKTVAGVQSFALRNFLSLLDSVPTQTSKELTLTVVKFINSINNQGINNSVEKLLLIRRCLEHPKLKRHDIVHTLLPSICKILHYHMGPKRTKDERAACATIIQKCIQFLDPRRCRSVIYNYHSDKYPTLLPPDKNLVIPSSQLYDEFAILMLKLFAILDEIRSNDLSTNLVSVQKIFGKQIKKNKIIKESQLNTRTIISNDQLLVHRDFFITIADLSHVITAVEDYDDDKQDRNDNDNDEADDGADGDADDITISSWGDKCDRIDKAITTLRKEDEDNAVRVIESALKCCNNLLQKSTFNHQWIIMKMVEAELAMRCLSWFGSTLKRNYLSKSFGSGKELWKQWLSLGMIYLWNEDFTLEDMNNERRDIILNNYGDIRNIAIRQITTAWDVLTPHRGALADTMICAAVEASSSEVLEIQQFAVDVYYEMIRSEFESHNNNIQSVETHTIDQIDQLTAKYSNKEHVINRYLDFFRIHVRRKLDISNTCNEKLTLIGNTFLNDIERLYDYLVQLKKLPHTAEYEDERTSATLKLLEYLSSTGKSELYNRYIHHLALMHQSLSNHIEAAICFSRHGDRLGWQNNASMLLPEEPMVGLASTTECKRHINLCELAHKHFMLGEHWEMGVAVCQELSKAYQHKVFDLRALSSTLEKESHLWKLIGNQDRVFHRCYLVRFRGTFVDKHTSDDIENKSFVYRSGIGKKPENVRDFTQRIKEKYDGAKVINSAAPIDALYSDDDIKNERPFIQITTLTASSVEELNGGEFKWDCLPYSSAPLRLKKYYRQNETNTYFYTNATQKKKNKKDNEFRSLWITKTFIVCQDIIPSMRRRIPVIDEKIVEYTPFQTAINNLSNKNEDILKIIETLENDPTKSTNDISMNLNGILDAAVMGGVAKYREAFFDGTYLNQFPEETEIVPKFVTTLKQQMQIAKNGLDAYDKYAIDALQPHIDHLKSCYKKQIIALSDFYKETQKYSTM